MYMAMAALAQASTMPRRLGTGGPCSALDPVDAGRGDHWGSGRSSRLATCPCCPARTLLWPESTSYRSCIPIVRPRSVPRGASAHDGRRHSRESSTIRRFRFAGTRWRDRQSAGPVPLSPGVSVRSPKRALGGKVPEGSRPTSETWMDSQEQARDQTGL
jgi:hypothetical protein